MSSYVGRGFSHFVPVDIMLQGCDASNPINSTPTNTAELDALPNLTLHGMDLIDKAKAAMEDASPALSPAPTSYPSPPATPLSL